MYMSGLGTEVDLKLASKYALGALMNMTVDGFVMTDPILI